MSILDKLNQEIINQYKSGNQERRVCLQTIKAALINKQKELGDSYDEDAEVKVLKSELKQREEASKQYEQGQRQDLVNKMAFEIKELKSMLPEEMPDEDIQKIVSEIVEDNPDYNFGQIMKDAMAKIAGAADGKRVSEIVSQIKK